MVIALHYWFDFCHPSTWISHRYTDVPSLWKLPPSNPLGGYRAHFWVPWALQQISIGYLFYMWKFICFHAVLSICLTLSFLSLALVRMSVLCVCVCIAALWIGSSGLSFWIPYICINMQCLFFWLTSHCRIGSSFIHLKIDSNALLFMSSTPLHICTTAFFPFICRWTSGLLPCPSYCK